MDEHRDAPRTNGSHLRGRGARAPCRALGVIVSALSLVASSAGCTSLLGDFAIADTDAAVPNDGSFDGSFDASLDGSFDSANDTQAGDASPPDAGAEAGDACVGETDAELCMHAGKNCQGIVATDSCGRARAIASCGTCTAPQTCGAQTANVCGCAGETDPQFCARLGKSCGTVTGVDNCGASRTVASCGVCTSPQVCGAHVANVCGDPVCTPETDAQLCARYARNCGTFTNLDNCGSSRTVNCGTCTGSQTCGAVTPNVCGCVAQSDAAFCASHNFTCGAQSGIDNCGNSRTNVKCGTCGNGNACNAGSCVCGTGAACSGSQTCCGSSCTDTTRDPNNCSACGRACQPGPYWTCSNSTCSCPTTASGGLCAGSCENFGYNPNCGGCGNTCGSGQSCCLDNNLSAWGCYPSGQQPVCH